MNTLKLHTFVQDLAEQELMNGKRQMSTGRWTKEEHEMFLRAIELRPFISWITVAQMVKTRDARQVRTHAQKHFKKLKQQSASFRAKYMPERTHKLSDCPPKLPPFSTLLAKSKNPQTFFEFPKLFVNKTQ